MHETMRETYQPPTISPASPPHDHTPGATTPLPPSTKFDTSRQNSTKIDRNSCPPACAHTREATTSVSSPHHRHSRILPTSFPHSTTVIPAPTHVIPAKAGIHPPAPRRIGHTAWNRRPPAVTPTNRTKPRGPFG